MKPHFLSFVVGTALLALLTGCSETPSSSSHDHDHDHGHDHSHGHDHDHDHDDGHAHTPNDGAMAPFTDGLEQVGFLELKLHDDKGDLELWLTKDGKGTVPFDLPLETTLKVSFPDLEQDSVTLQVRNTEKNEDEGGTPTIRDQKTNYFIFPGDTGVDATFLMGTEFSTNVVVSFSVDGTNYVSAPFKLVPHTVGHFHTH